MGRYIYPCSKQFEKVALALCEITHYCTCLFFEHVVFTLPLWPINRLRRYGNLQDARRSGRHTKQWWLKPGTRCGSEEEDSGHCLTSTALCNHLYLEAVQRGVQVNGKICNAVMVGFGADLTVSGSSFIVFLSFVAGSIALCLIWKTRHAVVDSFCQGEPVAEVSRRTPTCELSDYAD